MQRRVLSITVGVIAVLLVLAPIGMGFVVERVYLDVIADADGSADGLRVTGAIERGLWISTAETTIEHIDDAGRSVMVLRHALVHGPVPLGEILRGRSPLSWVAAVVDSRYQAEPAELPEIAAALDGRPLMQLTTWLYFDQSVYLRFAMPKLQIEGGVKSSGLRADARLEIDGDDSAGWVRTDRFVLGDDESELAVEASELQFEMRPAAAGARATGTLEVGAIAMRGPSGPMTIAPSSGRYEGTLLGGVVGDGAGTLGIGDIVIGAEPAGDGAAPGARLHGLEIEEAWGLDADTGLRSFETTTSFDTLTQVGGEYGPGRVVLAARRIDPSAASGFRDAMTALESSGLEERERALVRQALFAEWMPRVFGTSPEVVLETLSLESPGGELIGRGRIGVDGSDPAFLADPVMLWMQTSAELVLAVPAPLMQAMLDAYLIESVREEMGDVSDEELAEMASFMRDAMLAQFVAQGLLVVEGDGYRVDARLADGLPTINGQLVDPSQLGSGAPGGSGAPE